MLFPHSWVRSASCRLLTLYLSRRDVTSARLRTSTDGIEVLTMSNGLYQLARRLCLVLNQPRLTDALLDSAVTALVFTVRAMTRNPELSVVPIRGKVEEGEEEEEEDEEEEDEEEEEEEDDDEIDGEDDEEEEEEEEEEKMDLEDLGSKVEEGATSKGKKVTKKNSRAIENNAIIDSKKIKQSLNSKESNEGEDSPQGAASEEAKGGT
jgi:hypothetical protein